MRKREEWREKKREGGMEERKEKKEGRNGALVGFRLAKSAFTWKCKKREERGKRGGKDEGEKKKGEYGGKEEKVQKGNRR